MVEKHIRVDLFDVEKITNMTLIELENYEYKLDFMIKSIERVRNKVVEIKLVKKYRY